MLMLATTATDKFGLTKRDIECLYSILSKYPAIELVYVFGSRAKGNFKPGSDIDLAIMNAGITDEIIRSLKVDFEESTLPYMVDAINYSHLKSQQLKEHIDRVGVPFFVKTR